MNFSGDQVLLVSYSLPLLGTLSRSPSHLTREAQSTFASNGSNIFFFLRMTSHGQKPKLHYSNVRQPNMVLLFDAPRAIPGCAIYPLYFDLSSSTSQLKARSSWGCLQHDLSPTHPSYSDWERLPLGTSYVLKSNLRTISCHHFGQSPLFPLLMMFAIPAKVRLMCQTLSHLGSSPPQYLRSTDTCISEHPSIGFPLYSS